MESESPEPAEAYLLLRSRILNLKPEEMGLYPGTAVPLVWGVVMETGYSVGFATLVSIADGTTSLYYSTGGGILGSGDYKPVADAARALVAQAESHLAEMSATSDLPLPEVGQVRFALLTFTGTLTAQAPEKALLEGGHALSPLYARAQETLAQLRILSGKKRSSA